MSLTLPVYKRSHQFCHSADISIWSLYRGVCVCVCVVVFCNLISTQLDFLHQLFEFKASIFSIPRLGGTGRYVEVMLDGSLSRHSRLMWLDQFNSSSFSSSPSFFLKNRTNFPWKLFNSYKNLRNKKKRKKISTAIVFTWPVALGSQSINRSLYKGSG